MQADRRPDKGVRVHACLRVHVRVCVRVHVRVRVCDLKRTREQ